MSIYRRPSGRWYVILAVDAGSKHRTSLGTYATKKEAEKAERDALVSREGGGSISRTTLTVEGLIKRYIADRTLGEKTVEEYERLARLYVTPHLGSTVAAKLRPAHVSGWISALQVSGGQDGSKLSPRSAKLAYGLLNASLRWGVRMELIDRNVCEVVGAPKTRKSEARALTAADTSKLVTAAQETRWAPFILLALASGCRRGELLALTWHDVSAESIVIRASLAQTKAKVFLKGTKSGRVRSIPLSATAKAALSRQKAMQAADKLKLGASYIVDPARPVFTDEQGQRLSPKAATNAFARIAKAAGVAVTSLHSTRHTSATALISGGVDIQTAASILGHSSPVVTLGLYSHLIEGSERQGVDVLSAAIDKALGK